MTQRSCTNMYNIFNWPSKVLGGCPGVSCWTGLLPTWITGFGNFAGSSSRCSISASFAAIAARSLRYSASCLRPAQAVWCTLALGELWSTYRSCSNCSTTSSFSNVMWDGVAMIVCSTFNCTWSSPFVACSFIKLMTMATVSSLRIRRCIKRCRQDSDVSTTRVWNVSHAMRMERRTSSNGNSCVSLPRPASCSTASRYARIFTMARSVYSLMMGNFFRHSMHSPRSSSSTSWQRATALGPLAILLADL
mmetsp:Transcript_64491/g.153988  ORF Transcript_64491/g.153988 Transcript_64491/m.153988 type:complete len:249 (+) Transcript_64491:4882-5628(+)